LKQQIGEDRGKKSLRVVSFLAKRAQFTPQSSNQDVKHQRAQSSLLSSFILALFSFEVSSFLIQRTTPSGKANHFGAALALFRTSLSSKKNSPSPDQGMKEEMPPP
jgi:hypothetical protein